MCQQCDVVILSVRVQPSGLNLQVRDSLTVNEVKLCNVHGMVAGEPFQSSPSLVSIITKLVITELTLLR